MLAFVCVTIIPSWLIIERNGLKWYSHPLLINVHILITIINYALNQLNCILIITLTVHLV